VRALIRSGHIDCLHSYGDLATTRDHARRALDELAAHDCRLGVWVDHGTAPTNFGQDIMQGHGDEPGHPAYHADLSTAHGIRYVWRGRVTSVTGQDVLPALGGVFESRHPLCSAQTLAKEWSKRVLARCGSTKYAMHATNDILRPVRLRDGTPAYEFIRCNPHWGGVSSYETAKGIGDVLTDAFLNRLAAREGLCILYTHLGKVRDPRVPLDASAVAGFRRLAGAFQDGRILVTTTRRLLGFSRAAREVKFVARRDGKVLQIDIDTTAAAARDQAALPRADLDGLTFYVPDAEAVCVNLDGREVSDIQSNAADHTGRRSVSLPWRRLEFPSL